MMESKHIDKIFKEGLNDTEFMFDENDWNELKKKLNERKGPSKIRKMAWRYVIGAAAVLLILIGKEFITSISNQVDNKDIQSHISGFKMQKNHENKDIQEEDNYLKDQVRRSTVATNDFFAEAQRNNIDTFYLDQYAHINLAGSESDKNTVSLYTDSVSLQLSNLSLSATAVDMDTSRMQISYIETVDSSLLAQNRIKSNNDVSAFIQEFNQEKVIESVEKNAADWGSLAILVGPDLTSVRGAGESSWSQNIGILYQKTIIKRLSLTTGFLYAKKNYTSPFSFYNPRNIIQFNEEPTNVAAVCNILEVPLGLSLEFWHFGKTKLGLNFGVSSYFMLREQYRFAYENTQDRLYEIKGENKHIFGVGDVSIRLEHKISPMFSVGIQPFYKIPLTGIGYGRAQLDSKGIALLFGVDLGKKVKW